MAWACWWHGHVGGMGMLVAWACWWNGHLARYQSLASRSLSHPTQFPTPDSRLPTPCSRLPTPYSLS
ncbi:MAG: hypothetical protein F6K59_27620 [Moorea sp. SIO3F7]|nr:hypothetical protein [Moorena sp. SIO3F7]